MAVDYHIVQVQPKAHYNGAPTMWHCFFKSIFSLSETSVRGPQARPVDG